MVVAEGLLDVAESVIILDALNGLNLASLDLPCKEKSRSHEFSVNDDIAAPAYAVLATNVSPWVVEIFSKAVEQCPSSLDRCGNWATVQ
jgi:hypothetical protein